MCIVSAKLQNLFVAPDALQQNKSGPRPKKVGNHCPSVTMMHLCITQCTYWTPLVRFEQFGFLIQ